MKPISQAELHPDADSLNAFVEQALAAPEREQILLHMAGCGRCRQVVYLAQQAAADAEAALVPAVLTANRPSAWRRNWRLAWVPAAALASIVALVVTFHPGHIALGPDLAKSAPQNAPLNPSQTEAKAGQPALPPKPGLPEQRGAAFAGVTGRAGQGGTSVGTVAGTAAGKAAGKAQSASGPKPSDTITSPPALPDLPALSVNNAALSAPGASAQDPEPQPASAQPKPQTTVAVWQQEQMAGAVQKKASAAPRVDAGLHGTEQRFQARRTITAAAPAPQRATASAVAGSLSLGALRIEAGQAAPLQPSALKMPSGLRSISTATAGQHMLAIDLAGALFLSEDQGKNWQPVARQWTGRPLAVKTQNGPNANPAQGALFQMTCDNGSTWVSPDGKNWSTQ